MEEDDFWKGIRKNFGWNMYVPNKLKQYSITIFDDGNKKYEHLINSWYIYGEWKDKVAIVNSSDPEIKIGSISLWKLI
jgi:hypothetical protein